MGGGRGLLEGCFLGGSYKIVELDSYASARLKSFLVSDGYQNGAHSWGVESLFEFVAYGKRLLGRCPFVGVGLCILYFFSGGDRGRMVGWIDRLGVGG